MQLAHGKHTQPMALTAERENESVPAGGLEQPC